MGKAALCMKMLQILNSGRIYKVAELADLLETTPRNVLEYKKEIEEAGYCITSIPGRFGGYRLDKAELFPSLVLSEPEKKALCEAEDYILQKYDFPKKKEFETAMGKVFSNFPGGKRGNSMLVVEKYRPSMKEEDTLARYQFLEDAIAAKRAIRITYRSLKNGPIEHVLHPYQLVLYNNAWFFLAFNPDANDIWTFKVNRIEHYEMLDQKFSIASGFKATNYFGQSGLANGGEFYPLKFKASGIHASLLKERVYGKDQKITENEDGTVLCELEMQNKSIVVNFALGWGKDMKVIKPIWLRDEIRDYADWVQKTYPRRGKSAKKSVKKAKKK